MRATFDKAARGDHVPEVERFIQTVKGSARATKAMTPYARLPLIMVKELVVGSVYYRTMVCTEGGITPHLSARMIIVGETLDLNRHA